MARTGRPKKLTLDFFIHDHDARCDRKVRGLRRRHGNDGYATYFILLEMLCSEDGLILNLSDPLDVETAVEECGTRDDAHLYAIIQTCVELRLLDRQMWESERCVFSHGLYQRYEARLQQRKADAEKKRNYRKAKQVEEKLQAMEEQQTQNSEIRDQKENKNSESYSELDQSQGQTEDKTLVPNGQVEDKSGDEQTIAKSESSSWADKHFPNADTPIAPDHASYAQKCDRMFEVLPWGSYQHPEEDFLDWLAKSHLSNIDYYKNQGVVTRHDAKFWLNKAQRSEERLEQAKILYEKYSQSAPTQGIPPTHPNYDWEKDPRSAEWCEQLDDRHIGLWEFCHPDGTNADPERDAFRVWYVDRMFAGGAA
ncbi:MAG: Lin1244/Lin1753 domain-containing protein [Cyanobacteria bacterium J06638_20]